ncbi:MAG TPA: protein kinase [Actinocrinis sp.]|nr:protein kinase [Actinocrinis sp.]
MSDPRWIGARYELLERLGGGADGSLWRGWDLTTGADCVARLVQLDSTAGTGLSAAARWNQLVRTLDAVGRLAHPGLVAVDDIVADDGRWVLISRLVPGQSLEARLASTGALPPAEAARIVAQVCDALAAAHEAGLAHGRVKPSNVLLEPADDGAVVGGAVNVRLSDFGLAALESWAAHHTAPDPLVLAARARYRPPEWIPGMPTTAAGDVYAAGVVLYEALTGSVPADGTDPAQIASPLRELPSGPRGAADVFRVLLADCREGRPRLRPTAAQMAHRLRGTTPGPRIPIPHSGSTTRGGAHARHAQEAPPLAKPPGRHRDMRTLRRVEVAASATAVALVGGLTFTLGDGRAIVPPAGVPTRITITQSAITTVGHTRPASAPTSSAVPGADAAGGGGAGPSSGTPTSPATTPGSGSPTGATPATPGSVPSASPETAPSATPTAPRNGLPVSDPIGYLEQLRAMIQLMASEGPAVVDANAAGDLENLVLDLENGVDSYEQNGGQGLLQMIKDKISNFDLRLDQDRSRGLIAAGAAGQLSAYLQKLSPA